MTVAISFIPPIFGDEYDGHKMRILVNELERLHQEIIRSLGLDPDEPDVGVPANETNDLSAIVTWANIPDAFVPVSSVTQHVASIDHDLTLNFLTAEHVDWAGSGTGTIHATNVPEGAVTQHEAALSILENQIVDANILARITGNELITGAWQFEDNLEVFNTGVAGLRVTVAADGAVEFYTTDSSAVNKDIFLKAFSDGETTLFYNGEVRLITQSGGVAALYSTTNTDTETRLLELRHQNAIVRAEMGFLSAAGSTLIYKNRIHGGLVKLQAENAAGSLADLFTGDPDGAAKLLYANALKLETVTGGVDITGVLNIGGVQAATLDTNWAAGDIVSGTFADALIQQSNVTQHEAAIDHDALTNFVSGEHFLQSAISITGGQVTAGTFAGDMKFDGEIVIKEMAPQPVGESDYGVLWVKNETPNELWFTNDASQDFPVISDLVADTSPQLGGNLASNGFDILMADGDKISFGDAGDMTLLNIAGTSTSEIQNLLANAVLDFTFASSNKISFDGANKRIDIRDGWKLRIRDGTDVDFVDFSHSGTDFLTVFDGVTTGDWLITGLQGALKVGGVEVATLNTNWAAGDITADTFADARIAESNVTQHEAAIDHDALTNFLTAEHVDWAGAGAGTIHTDNYIENATHTGDVSGSGVLTIAADAVTYAKMQNVVADERLLGNVSGAGGIVAELTQAQVITFLGIEAGATADQTSIVGITGTKAQFDTAVSDGNIAYVGGAHHDGFSDFVSGEHFLQSAISITGGQVTAGTFAGDMKFDGEIVIKERASVVGESAYGVLWVKTATPNELWFTDDASADFKVAPGASDLVNDTSPQLGANLASNGFDILMADGDKVIFGDGGDMQMFNNAGTATSTISNLLANAILDFTFASSNKISFDGASKRVDIRDGWVLRVRDSTDADFADFSHDGTDFLTVFDNPSSVTQDWSITGLTGTFRIEGPTPIIELREDDAGVDEKVWYMGATSVDRLIFQTRDDDDTAGEIWMNVLRVGSAVTEIELLADEILLSPSGAVIIAKDTSIMLDADATTGRAQILTKDISGVDQIVIRRSGSTDKLNVNSVNLDLNLRFNNLLFNGAATIPEASVPTHTGDVEGGTDLSLVVAAITSQTALTSGLADADELLVSDGGVIKRMDITVLEAFMLANLAFATTAFVDAHVWNANDITAGTLLVARGGTGVTAKTGTGNVVLSTSPTLVTPVSARRIATAISDRDKLRVYSSTNYTIGMQSGITFGGLADWGMTFQFSNHSTRGFWWGDDNHTAAQGAMALTTLGKLTLAHSIRVGYGETDTTAPGATWKLDVNGPIRCNGADTKPAALNSALSANMLHIDGKEAIDGNDTWMRLNQNGDFSSGVYTPGHMLFGSTTQFTGAMDVNGNINGDGATIIDGIETLKIDATGDITKVSHGNYLYHQSAVYDDDQEGGITFSTAAASLGADGDIWFRYTA